MTASRLKKIGIPRRKRRNRARDGRCIGIRRRDAERPTARSRPAVTRSTHLHGDGSEVVASGVRPRADRALHRRPAPRRPPCRECRDLPWVAFTALRSSHDAGGACVRRQAGGAGSSRRKQRAVDAFDERGQLTLVGRLNDEHTARFVRRKPPIVQVVAVHGDERAPQLLREPIVRRRPGRGAARLLRARRARPSCRCCRM